MSAPELQEKFQLYNALGKKLTPFRPIQPPHVGLYVCGPTVYGDVHAGNIRTFLSFDILQRFLRYIGYEVRYVRNITDVGHLTGTDQHTGEDKVAQAAKRMHVDPYVLTEHYTRSFRSAMHAFGIQPPQLEPRATAHIDEQLQLIARLFKAGYAHEVDGSVYFDLQAYQKKHPYGQLSGRDTENLYTQTRTLKGQQAKRHPHDFALWKRVEKEHLMQWHSPWGMGAPGWHLECSAMSEKYLGRFFDIHGGGMDLKFPHHECELAQAIGAYGNLPAAYWVYANMLTVDGQKMSKSADNVLTFNHLTQGTHPRLPKPYSPMVLRFFMLQTHYGSVLNFSADAVAAAEKGYIRLMNGLQLIKELHYPEEYENSPIDEAQQATVLTACNACADAMCQDLNTSATLAALFSLLKSIHALKSKQLAFGALGKSSFHRLQRTYIDYVEHVLGLEPPPGPSGVHLLKSLITLYKEAKCAKQYDVVDSIRVQLRAAGITLQDLATGEVQWSYAE